LGSRSWIAVKVEKYGRRCPDRGQFDDIVLLKEVANRDLADLALAAAKVRGFSLRLVLV
jgi:hypothetical protein